MIRDSVLGWATILVLAVLAFILLPSYERFKDAGGREVDIAPGAPPLPKELIPIDERSGERVTAAPASGYDYLDWLNRERFVDASGQEVDVAPDAPPMPEELKPQKPGAAPPVPPSTVAQPKPSGVKVLPSQSMPANAMLGTANKNVGLDKKQLNVTIPPPKFESGPQGIQSEDKYVLKSSLVPCSCAAGYGMSCEQHSGSYPSSTVPGDMDSGGMMTEDDLIKKPFQVAFDTGGEAPSGYLNSFSAFMK